MINLLGLTFAELKDVFLANGLSNLDAKRVYPWIHVKLASSFSEMSDVPLKVREVLMEKFSLSRGNCIAIVKSKDCTQKAILEFSDGATVETVFIPDENRNTICVSSQVGCLVGCKFCHTGTQNFSRNLTASEILSQVFFWKDVCKAENEGQNITNIVFMGMGEPLLNIQNLESSLELILSEKAHNFSRTKVTVSTSGIINGSLERIAKFGVKLAISLHAANDEKRTSLMPINKKYDIKTVFNAAFNYLQLSNTDYVTFEYLLLSGINDSEDDALELASILRNKPARINLIIYNDWPGSCFTGTNRDKANKFSRILLSKNIRTLIRKSRGNDILAACGQLKTQIDKEENY